MRMDLFPWWQIWIWPALFTGLLASNNTTTAYSTEPSSREAAGTNRVSDDENQSPTPSWREIARNKSRLVKDLLTDYDKRIRPFTGVSPLEVRVDMFISNIWAIEEARMDFTIDMYLRQYWTDPRLRFYAPLANKEALTLNRQTIDEIWIPSTYFFNAKKAYFHDVTTENYLLMIQPNGDVFYSVRLTITMACKLTLQQFPHDVQKCEMIVESYGYQATDVFYRWNSRNTTNDVVYIAEDLEMPQFKITNIELEERTNIYNIGPHSALAAKFTFHRRLGYYMIQTYIPSMLTVIISWFSFWISPDSPPARVGLGITTVLTMITISNSARAPLPKVSYTKAIDWFLLMCLVYVFGALMEYAIVNFHACKVRKKKQERINSLSKRMRREFMNFNHDDELNPCLNEEEITNIQEEDQEQAKKITNNSEQAISFKPLTGIVIDRKNPFVLRTETYKRSGKTKTPEISELRSSTSTSQDETTGPLSKPYYFWDPDQKSFITSERAYIVDRFARISFPVTFAVLISIYWIVYAPDRIIF
ncbi:glycine receptor subunit alpha-4-like [Actinia tenebrosa]|uniref:Glycine receptor subunit alpha-4-like n=1 Tax=Actinia tenebrosa TaxID=6105 RepID=A0A6P8HEF3_ACTTE|nr:glycine receptor subunit alpha-4-like [Actinia tenebrosa]